MTSNYHNADTSKSARSASGADAAISRREVGKVWWKSVINELLDSEKEDLEALRILRRKVTDAESLGIIAGLLERKAERVIELNLLLRYRDAEKEAKSANG
jgi:hypothetical protein